jgi:hypothetical protein
MTRRRYIQSKEPPYNLIEVTEGYEPDRRVGDSALWGDRHYDGLRATDGTDISSRSKQREYMRLNNLTTADDFKETWAKAKEARERYHTQGGSFNRRDIERAIHQLQNRR